MPRLTVIKSKSIFISTLRYLWFIFSVSPLDIYEIFTSIVGVHSTFLRRDSIRFVIYLFFSPLLSFSLIFHKQRNESSIVPLVVFVSLAFSTSHECPRVLLWTPTSRSFNRSIPRDFPFLFDANIRFLKKCLLKIFLQYAYKGSSYVQRC